MRRVIYFALTLLGATAVGFVLSLVAIAAMAPTPSSTVRTVMAASRALPDPREVDEVARADDTLVRKGRDLLPTGSFYVPPSFHSRDGQFDLLIHFHGNVELVTDSVASARLNALVLVINLGNGASAYQSGCASPGLLDHLIEQVQNAAEARGLQNAKVRRIALTAWSAGYAAVANVLTHQGARIDAVALMDGLHAPFVNKRDRVMDPTRLDSIVEFGRRAASGNALLVVTHSHIDTYGYASTLETTDYLIDALGGKRRYIDDEAWPPRVELASARRATPSSHTTGLEQTSEAHVGDAHVYGFRGRGPEHHIDHLSHMSVTVLPPLVARWSAAGS